MLWWTQSPAVWEQLVIRSEFGAHLVRELRAEKLAYESALAVCPPPIAGRPAIKQTERWSFERVIKSS